MSDLNYAPVCGIYCGSCRFLGTECKGCGYVCVCRGGCPAIPYNLGTGIDGWDPHSCYKVFIGEKQMEKV